MDFLNLGVKGLTGTLPYVSNGVHILEDGFLGVEYCGNDTCSHLKAFDDSFFRSSWHSVVSFLCSSALVSTLGRKWNSLVSLVIMSPSHFELGTPNGWGKVLTYHRES